MLAKEQKHELALVLFGLANGRNYSHQGTVILDQDENRGKGVGFFKLEPNPFPKGFYEELPVLPGTRPGCMKYLCFSWDLKSFCLQDAGSLISQQLNHSLLIQWLHLSAALQNHPGVPTQRVQSSAAGMQSKRAYLSSASSGHHLNQLRIQVSNLVLQFIYCSEERNWCQVV